MSIFDTAVRLDGNVTTVTAELYWEIPTNLIGWATAHTDDLDIVAVALDASGCVTNNCTSYIAVSACGTMRHSGENVNGRGKRGVPRETITVDLNDNPNTAIFFAVKTLEGAGLHHSQNSSFAVDANGNLHTAEISNNPQMKNMRSAILGVLLQSPEGNWHYAPQAILSVCGYMEDVQTFAVRAHAQMMRA
ncbi:MAG: hypothetical protein PVI21_06425 [Candidatus Woesebacteria bacterium]|jgi:stress response protein SCP2